MRQKYLSVIILFCLSACQQITTTKIPESIDSSNLYTATMTAATPTLESSQTKSPISKFTSTSIRSETPFPTQTPLLIVPYLDGIVKELSHCRYGAGAAYISEWGLNPGDSVRILNRNGDGTWVYVKPITYNNECWVKASLLDYKGNVNSLEEYYAPLPYVYTYLYKPVQYVIVIRNGNEVIINWDPVWMTEDDDRGYLIEAWVCQDGKFVFLPINYFPYTNTTAKIQDEPGCLQESHARFYTVEKHGYMPFIEIPWPNYK
jgi:hypothetical protein